MIRVALSYCLVWVAVSVSAADTLQLTEVVKTEYLHSAKHLHVEGVESKSARRLSDVLQEFSSVYVKNYGVGQLATISVRGSSSAQNEIQWNGIRINNPSLGQSDLSLFLLGTHHNISLSRNGQSGVIGGILNMQDDNKAVNRLAFTGLIRAGSFGKYETIGKLNYGNSRVWGETNVIYSTARNNFTYRNIFQEGSPLQQITNNRVQQISARQNMSFKIRENQELHVALWYTQAYREIPPVMSRVRSDESQRDYAFRTMLNWVARFEKWNVSVRSAYITDKIDYKNNETSLHAVSTSAAWRNIAQIDYYPLNNLRINGAIHADIENARADAYGGLKNRSIISLRSSVRYAPVRLLEINAAFRQDVVDGKPMAFSPQVQFVMQPYHRNGHSLTLGLVASRAFRVPTLNDLYWTPGGNPNLKPERSWNAEANLTYRKASWLAIEWNAYGMYVQDWIQWVSTPSYWQPVNYKKVLSRGTELAVNLSTNNQQRNRFGISNRLSYALSMVTQMGKTTSFDNADSRQLIYVPQQVALAVTEVHYRNFFIRAFQRYTSRIYTSADNSEWLKPFYTLDIEAGKDFKWKGHLIGLTFRVNNATNANYQTVAQRPMPGIHFEGALRFEFQHP